MNLGNKGKAQRLTAALFLGAVLSLALVPAPTQAGTPAPSASEQQALRQGERIYREGILPSGEPLRSSSGGVAVPGTSFACVSCHLRSGLGSLEGTVFTPPINGAKLFKPLQVYSSSSAGPVRPGSPRAGSFQVVHRRPPYTDASLARVLRSGIDASGRTLSEVMPRYLLADGDLKLLVSYLKTLSVEFSPGVTRTPLRSQPGAAATTLHFATVISEEVSALDQSAMLMNLENFIRAKNLTKDSGHDLGDRSPEYGTRFAQEAGSSAKDGANLQLSLARWVVKGAPETWRAQLEAYYRREPVFALLGGITRGEWQPVHQFCEENRIPCILPSTDFPVISPSDWYTLYFSKGYYQEGEGAASFLNDVPALQGKPVVQIVRDSREGRALSRGFQETWHDLGHKPPVTVLLKEGETLSAEFLEKELSPEKAAAIVLWDGVQSFRTLEALAGAGHKPQLVLVSASFLGEALMALPEKARDFTYMTYPYGVPLTPAEKSGLPRDGSQAPMRNQYFAGSVAENAVATKRIWQQSSILTMIVHMALEDLRGNYYRDNLLDVIGADMDQEVRLYERLSFGPGQRYAAKGCSIVQLGKAGLVKRSGGVSGWATQ